MPYDHTPELARKPKDRRRALRPAVEAIVRHPEDVLTVDADSTELDQQKLERNAIAAVIINQTVQYSVQQRSQRPPYGLLGVTSARSLTVDRSLKSQSEYNRADHATAIRQNLQRTIDRDLSRILDDMVSSGSALHKRFTSVLEANRHAKEFIMPGLRTALETIELLINTGADVETVRNSYGLLAKFASEHLEVALSMLRELGHHPEYVMRKDKPDGTPYLDLTDEAIQQMRELKETALSNGAKTITTGCPALIKLNHTEGNNTSAIQEILNWYCDVAEKVLS